MLKTVRLYGHLARQFGREFKFHVASPAEAVAALKATVPGFEAYMIAHSAPGYHLFTGRQNIGQQQLAHPTGDIIRIVPAIAGAKQGVLQTVLGVVLLAIAYIFPVTAPYLGPAGISLILGGISQMLFAPHKSDGNAKPNNLPSYAFNGAVNTAQQGNPVAIGYGRMVVGSQVIAAGLYVESL
ncbi:tail assembly protein [Sulfuriferula sp.]|uniref:tail assembly protein n=1 Tax=Sulfuriferula sp. TaxID=2025307 RepID=UPI0027317111|nr:hypothetical protein [Sulfuriferula sp.]MDP1619716.1 tail assembly protein [bacterium]MDP2026456.1 hypothetical protein [Sulfuriferula sp.]